MNIYTIAEVMHYMYLFLHWTSAHPQTILLTNSSSEHLHTRRMHYLLILAPNIHTLAEIITYYFLHWTSAECITYQFLHRTSVKPAECTTYQLLYRPPTRPQNASLTYSYTERPHTRRVHYLPILSLKLHTFAECIITNSCTEHPHTRRMYYLPNLVLNIRSPA